MTARSSSRRRIAISGMDPEKAQRISALLDVVVDATVEEMLAQARAGKAAEEQSAQAPVPSPDQKTAKIEAEERRLAGMVHQMAARLKASGRTGRARSLEKALADLLARRQRNREQ